MENAPTIKGTSSSSDVLILTQDTPLSQENKFPPQEGFTSRFNPNKFIKKGSSLVHWNFKQSQTHIGGAQSDDGPRKWREAEFLVHLKTNLWFSLLYITFLPLMQMYAELNLLNFLGKLKVMEKQTMQINRDESLCQTATAWCSSPFLQTVCEMQTPNCREQTNDPW